LSSRRPDRRESRQNRPAARRSTHAGCFRAPASIGIFRKRCGRSGHARPNSARSADREITWPTRSGRSDS
jgi:hypothetical protein